MRFVLFSRHPPWLHHAAESHTHKIVKISFSFFIMTSDPTKAQWMALQTKLYSRDFVVSAITFEGFILRSSNLTHALLIQISRTSSIIDIVVQFNMAAGGHFDLKWQEMRSKVIFGNPKVLPATILSKIKNKKFRIDLKWPEMRSKVIFGHPKWPPVAILWKIFTKIKIAVSIRNCKKCDQKLFWTSKLAPCGHLKKNNITNKSCDGDLNNVRIDCWPTTT